MLSETHCWSSSYGGDSCKGGDCKYTQCHGLTDSTEVFTLAFIERQSVPTYYVEFTFNNEEVEEDVEGENSGNEDSSTFFLGQGFTYKMMFIVCVYLYF